MAASLLFFMASAAVLVAALLLLVVCVNCRGKNPPASITQAKVGEDYIPATGYQVEPQWNESSESDAEDSGYIFVLPEQQIPAASPSRASSPSFGVQHDYVNVEECEGSSENPDYLNVEPLDENKATSETSSQSDDEGNYVNQ